MASIVIKRFLNDTKDYHVIEISGSGGNILATRYGKVGVAGRFDSKAYDANFNGQAAMSVASRKVAATRSKNGYTVDKKNDIETNDIDEAIVFAKKHLDPETFGKVKPLIEKCYTGTETVPISKLAEPVSTENEVMATAEHYDEGVWGTW